MTDQELLELAAKAFDDDGIEFQSGHYVKFLGQHEDMVPCYRVWNPLTDDGDALRLAVKLEMEINCMELSQFQITTYDGNGNATYTDDSCVRRAIVRAAAEIGKGM